MDETTIIKRVLKGTRHEVTLALTVTEYAHLQLIEGQRPGLRIPLDGNVAGEMSILAAHFERPGREPLTAVKDEARDAAELVF